VAEPRALTTTNAPTVWPDGSTIEVRGDEAVEYDGEIHTAANLHEALKEGYYGKF